MKISTKRILVGLNLLLMLAIVIAIVLIVAEHTRPTGLVVYTEEKNPELIVSEFPEAKLYWNHMPLTYNLDSDDSSPFKGCKGMFDGKVEKDIESALAFISNRTNNSITFQRTNSSNPDIMFICDIGQGQRNGEYATIAEATPFVYKGTNLASHGEIKIYSTYKYMDTDKPVAIIHETLHLLGLEHPTGSVSVTDIMHPTRQDYRAEISDKDLEFLMRIYG